MAMGWSACLFVAAGVPLVLSGRIPLDIAGSFDQASISRCREHFSPWCMNSSRHGTCVRDGCTFVERMTLGSPDKNGHFEISVSAVDNSCWTSTWGPHQMNVDEDGRVLGGVRWGAGSVQYFDPSRLEQSMNLVVLGNVVGFDGNPAGFRHVSIEYENVTVCDTPDSCTPGTGRFVCKDRFAYCAEGDCFDKNKHLRSHKEDGYFSRFSSTALNGTYMLDADQSSPDCPRSLNVYQYGSQLGVGGSREDMHLAQVVDTSLSRTSPSVVHFQTVCSGIQTHMDMAVAGALREVRGRIEMQVFLMIPWHYAGEIEVERCILRKHEPSPPLYDTGSGGWLTGSLVGVLLVSLLGNLVLLVLVLLRRRRPPAMPDHYSRMGVDH